MKSARRKTSSAGIQSVEVSAPLLAALASSATPMTLTSLAAAAGMTPSRAHKYLASLGRVGLVSQNGPTGRYCLGRFAAELGFAALRSNDVVDMSRETLEQLRDALDLTAVLTIWGNHGPTLVRKAENRQPIALFAQLGTVMPILTSSTGRVFAAYLDPEITAPFIKRELAEKNGGAARAGLAKWSDVKKLLNAVRGDGFAVSEGMVHSGVAGISVPIFNESGVAAVLNVVGMQGALDVARDGKPMRSLFAAAEALSCQLGKPLPPVDTHRPAADKTTHRANGRRRS